MRKLHHKGMKIGYGEEGRVEVEGNEWLWSDKTRPYSEPAVLGSARSKRAASRCFRL
jgi:hypothetical protein